MGFKLGNFLGKVAGFAVSTATHGAIRPSFQRPSKPRTGIGIGYFNPAGGGVGIGSFPLMPPDVGDNAGGGGGGGASGGSSMAGCPTGFRLNKSTYVTRGGGTSKWPVGLTVHPKGSTCVKRRHINAGNGRAATHAVRRLVAFYRLSNRVAKQLRKAAAKAHLHGARRGGQRQLSRGGGVEVVNVD